MQPASSIIFFTTASGAGYGLLSLLGVLAPAGIVPTERWLGLVALVLAFGLVTAGLLSSTFHLGHPERAWRALTQWRSSWLSREGVAALLTYLPAALFAIGWVFLEQAGGAWAVFGILSTLGAALTVYCTGMIYRTLRAIPQWHNRWVVPNYLALGLASGAVWLNALAHLFAVRHGAIDVLALVFLALAWAAKAVYWREIDGADPAATAESATGLGAIGRVRLLDAPHTEANYLMREMGFRLARKHGQKLRRLVHLAGFALPLLLSAIAFATTGWIAGLAAVLAALLASLGIVVERWLFFAEAKHTVQLYYGEAVV